MIILYGGGPGFGLPEISPFVMKTEVQFKLAGLIYEKRSCHPSEGPKGLFPFIDDAGRVIGDSTFIRTHVERRYGFDFDKGLDARGRAEAWTIERMIEDHLSGPASHARWLIRANFDKGPGRWFDQAPEMVRETLRENLRAKVADALFVKGIARHSDEEIVILGTRSLRALSLWLGDKPYLMGDKACGTDATAFGFLAMILSPFFDSPLRRRAESFANLVAYTDRMMERFYPEHDWTSGRRPPLGPSETLSAFAA